MKDGGGTKGSGGRKSPSVVQGQSPGGGLGVLTTYENNSQKHRLLVGQSNNNEIEGFGGRPGARAPLNPALD